MNTDKLDRIALEEFNFCPEMGRDDTKGLTKQQLFDGVRRTVARLQQEAEPALWFAANVTNEDGEHPTTFNKAIAQNWASRLGYQMQPAFAFPPAQPAQSDEVQEGMVLVPKVMTPEMRSIITNEHCVFGSAEALYKALLAAAPARPVGGEGE